MGSIENELGEGSRAVLNTDEFLARVKRTEAAYDGRVAARQDAAEARARKSPLDAESPARRIKRLANVGQQPMTSDERDLVMERILGKNDLVGITFVQRMLRAILATGRIVIRTPDGRGGYGTGFLVAPGVALTNNHVLPSESIAALSRIQFEYEEHDGGVLTEPVEFRLRPDLFFLTNAALDFSFVAVADNNEAGAQVASYGFVPLIESEGKIAINEPVNLVQHPSGERKRLALRENLLIDVLADFLHYEADTAPGSSGSPVFSDLWEVVALHHSGVPKRDQNGKILNRSDQIWRPEMGEDAVAWKANEGVRVSRILNALKAAQIKPALDGIRRIIFEAGSLPKIPLRQHSEQVSSKLPSAAPGLPVINNDGSATWTVPLVVTLGVGCVTAPIGASPPHRPAFNTQLPSGHTVHTNRPTPPPSPTTPTATDIEVADALAEFERARSEPYYNEAADRIARAEYYDSINGSPDAEKLTALLSETHRNPVRYDSGRSIYTAIDLHEDGMLRSIYSGVTFDPREAIEEVVRLNESIKAVEALIVEGRFTESTGSQQIDVLEAGSPFNCEHVVPQSWFSKREPMRGDMHHLFACGSRCNSFRGNTPYYDFPDFEEAIMDDCGKRETRQGDVNGFEPSRGKGIVARATLYFLVRYANQISRSSLPLNRIDIIVGWHRDDPPGRYELHRNQGIFRKQGNRNPFIDFPQWSAAIDFKGLLARGGGQDESTGLAPHIATPPVPPVQPPRRRNR